MIVALGASMTSVPPPVTATASKRGLLIANIAIAAASRARTVASSETVYLLTLALHRKIKLATAIVNIVRNMSSYMMLTRRTLFSHPSRRRQPPAASEALAAPQYRCSTQPGRLRSSVDKALPLTPSCRESTTQFLIRHFLDVFLNPGPRTPHVKC